MNLIQALDAIREEARRIQLSIGADLWSAIIRQLREENCFNQRYADAIEEIIGSIVSRLDDATVTAMWRETETGIADNAEDEDLFPDSVRMDLEVELLDEVVNLAHRIAFDGHI